MSDHPHLKNINDWAINYVTYVDTLRLFNEKAYNLDKHKMLVVNYKDFIIVYEKPSLQPILFEMKCASHTLGNIDNLDKKHIIQKVERLVENS